MGRVATANDDDGLDAHQGMSATKIAAWLAEHELVAVGVEELAAFEARRYELQAIYDGLHGHGMVIIQTATEDSVAWSSKMVAPRKPLDAPDLPPPYRGLRVIIHTGIIGLIVASSANTGTDEMDDAGTKV